MTQRMQDEIEEEILKKFPRESKPVRPGQNPDVVKLLSDLKEFERRSRETVIRVGGPNCVCAKAATCAL